MGRHRHNRRFARLTKAAKFRYTASFEEIDFNLKRNLSKNMFLRFSDCSFIKDKKNIIITGPTGVGKSYAASALGNQACTYDYRTFYFNMGKLFSSLKLARADGAYINRMQKIEKAELLYWSEPLKLDRFLRQVRIIKGVERGKDNEYT